MLYFHVDPIMGHGSEFQVTYTTIRSISEWFTFLWFLDWVKNLNLKSHIPLFQAFRNALSSCGSYYWSWIWIPSHIYNNLKHCGVYFTLSSHITKIQRVKMNHGLMLLLSMSGTVFVIMTIFIQGGLSPPEFIRAFLTGKKMPPWKKKCAPLKKKRRPPELKRAPPWKVQSARKFTADHQKCYMGHRVHCDF